MGEWKAEKDGIKVDLIFQEKGVFGDQTARWTVDFRGQGGEGFATYNIQADLKAVDDEKSGRVHLKFVNNKGETREAGTVEGAENGTPKLSMDAGPKYPTVDGLLLRRAAGKDKAP